MTPNLSPNTQAILLLTAPLIAGRGASSSDLLSASEYRRLARHLREMQRQPSDLMSPDATELLHTCQHVVDENRLRRSLGRGFLLSEVVGRWQSRAIWVISRADPEYPRRLKARLREDAPPILYGCGDVEILETGGLAVVGSRHVDSSLTDYATGIGQLVARARRTLVSGGAKGIDQAAMRGTLEAGGNASGVLADSLERTALNREHRNLLLDGQLVLISPYDPNAGFNVGNAMKRNKLIYALAEASLIVSSDLDKGGTWAGATEQLDKLHYVPVYVRSTGATSAGLDALRKKGAIPWPNPRDVEEFEAVFDVATPSAEAASKSGPTLFSSNGRLPTAATPQVMLDIARMTDSSDTAVTPFTTEPENQPATSAAEISSSATSKSRIEEDVSAQEVRTESSPAEHLFAVVRDEMLHLLKTPKKDAEIAAALEVSNAQAKAWIQRLVVEGLIEKKKKPLSYIVSQSNLFR